MPDMILVSRYDALIYDITLEQKNGTTGIIAPVTTGVVRAYLCAWPPSIGNALPATTTTLTHLGNGRYIGEVSAANMATALSAVYDDTLIAVIYELDGVMVRFREARAESILRVEAIGGSLE